MMPVLYGPDAQPRPHTIPSARLPAVIAAVAASVVQGGAGESGIVAVVVDVLVASPRVGGAPPEPLDDEHAEVATRASRRTAIDRVR